jgi:formiminoglutamase
MLDHWLRPITLPENDYHDQQFGQQLLLHDTTMPDLKKTRIAMLGIQTAEAQAVREQLYALSFPFQGLQVADLGDLRKAEVSFLIPVMIELLDSNIIPILIGNSAKWMVAQFRAYQDLNRAYINTVIFDEKIRFGESPDDYLSTILNPAAKMRYNVSIIGSQSHYLTPATLKSLSNYSLDYTGLGKARSAISEMEPIIRDADMAAFCLSALRQSDAPGQEQPSPSGFLTEETCQLARYAGWSDKLSSLGIYDFQADLDVRVQTAQVVAQLIWYFIEGVAQRKQDYPVSTSGMTEYIVDFKGHDLQLTFWKSTRSGRWWLQVPTESDSHHRLVSCSYQDYLKAGNGELPDRLLHALQRYR